MTIDGQKLQEIRLSKHMTQREVAMRSGLTNVTVSRLERAVTPRVVRPRTLRSLAAALDVEPDELIARD